MPIHKVNTVKDASFEAADATRDNSAGSGKAVVVIVIMIAVLAIAGCAYMYIKYAKTKKQLETLATPQGQQEVAKKEVKALLDKVGKLIVLPSDEEPTIATVTDADTLKKEQPFYRDAQNGNKVIIYMQSKKAIIYDEAKDILVNVGPIFVNENATATPTTEQTTD